MWLFGVKVKLEAEPGPDTSLHFFKNLRLDHPHVIDPLALVPSRKKKPKPMKCDR